MVVPVGGGVAVAGPGPLFVIVKKEDRLWRKTWPIGAAREAIGPVGGQSA